MNKLIPLLENKKIILATLIIALLLTASSIFTPDTQPLNILFLVTTVLSISIILAWLLTELSIRLNFKKVFILIGILILPLAIILILNGLFIATVSMLIYNALRNTHTIGQIMMITNFTSRTIITLIQPILIIILVSIITSHELNKWDKESINEFKLNLKYHMRKYIKLLLILITIFAVTQLINEITFHTLLLENIIRLVTGTFITAAALIVIITIFTNSKNKIDQPSIPHNQEELDKVFKIKRHGELK